jgi:drug/metabolite transporter (DMT)-like permease
VSASVLTAGRTTAPGPATWLPAFVALGAIWGSSFLFIKVGVRELHPMHLALVRSAAGAVTLVAVLLVTRTRLPRDRRLWGHLAVIAFVGNVIPFTLFGYGEQRISSILAGIWNGTTPLMVLIVAMVLLPEERPTRARIAGLLVGFVGVLVLLGVWRGVGQAELVGQLMCAAAAAGYGLAIPYTRRVINGRTHSGVAVATSQVLLATAELAILAPLLAGRPPAPSSLSVDVIASALALGALGTGIAFWLYYRLIRVAGATTTSTVTYLLPVFSTLLGITVLGEGLHWYEPVGALVVLAGIAVSQGLLTRRRPAPAPGPAPAPAPSARP